jgi:uncharacterized protein YmfQ (DUF2313 family)
VISEDYKQQILQLLPPGFAYTPTEGSILVKLIAGMAEELARIDARGDQVIEESDPRTTSELFQEWLTEVGIPDDCSSLAETPEDERNQLIQKLSSQPGQSRAFYVDLAEKLGYDSRVQEHEEFIVDDSFVEDPLYDAYWIHSFSLILSEAPVLARAGVARAGDRLGTFDAAFLFCLLQKAKPAHTVAFVGFE